MATSQPFQPDSNGTLPRGRGEILNGPVFLKPRSAFAVVSEILKNHPYIMGGIIVFLFVLAILAGA